MKTIDMEALYERGQRQREALESRMRAELRELAASIQDDDASGLGGGGGSPATCESVEKSSPVNPGGTAVAD